MDGWQTVPVHFASRPRAAEWQNGAAVRRRSGYRRRGPAAQIPRSGATVMISALRRCLPYSGSSLTMATPELAPIRSAPASSIRIAS